MTVQFKLSGSVGKMGANKPADVKIIQACLGGIKVKARPLYKGKADGKAGKDLIDAICTFQGAEKIKPSGKIMPGDSTTSKLKMRTPSSVQIPKEAAIQDPTLAMRARNAASATEKEVRNEIPLPDADAKALEKIVHEAARQGMVLKVKTFEVTYQGRFKIELYEVPVRGLAFDGSTQGRAKAAAAVTKIVQKNSRWMGGSSSNMIYMTPPLDSDLKPNQTPDPGMAVSAKGAE